MNVLENDPSQNYIISRLMPLLIDHPSQIVVDVGANDGKNLSNSYTLIDIGWKGILVEPNPYNIDKIVKLWENNPYVMVYKGALSNFIGNTKLFADTEGFDKQSFSSTIDLSENEWTQKTIDRNNFLEVEVTTLSNLLYDANIQSDKFAYLSIDTEGHDLAVLEGLGHYRPSFITTERDVWDVGKAHRKQALLSGYGYVSAYHIGCNEIYVNSNCDYIKNISNLLANLY